MNTSVSLLPSANLAGVNSGASLAVTNGNISFSSSSYLMNPRNGIQMVVLHMNNRFGFKSFQPHVDQSNVQSSCVL